MGRPSSYSAVLMNTICDRISEGQSLREICRDEDMPDKRTILRWLDAHAEFRPQYARACEMRTEHWADEILEISDDGSNDWIERQNDDGSTFTTVNHEHISRSKLRVDSRKWLMSKLAPKKYGDKQVLAGDPDNPLEIIGKLAWQPPAK